jgi:predicted nuclease with RNAse H fold
MRTAGVDLAAEAANTAVAVIDWSTSRVTSLVHQATDRVVLDALVSADATGIDCPFGWPVAFLGFLNEHDGDELASPESSGRDWRRLMSYRRTDFRVHEATGRWPLSVSTDRIGVAAMRAAAILAAARSEGVTVDRTGGGRVAEVYPAAALAGWDLPSRAYKGVKNRQGREDLVDRLCSAVPWLDLGRFEADCRQSDDALDAVICSLVARAHALGLGSAPGEADHELATREGWIVLPQCALEQLR